MSGRHSPWHGVNLALAALVHLLFGAFWLVALAFVFQAWLGDGGAVIWVVSALVLGIATVVWMARASATPGRVWWLTFRWWLTSWVAPIALVVVWLRARSAPASTPVFRQEPEPEPERSISMDPQFPDQLADFELRLRELERELVRLKRLAATAAPVAPEPVPSVPPAAPAPPATPVPSMPLPPSEPPVWEKLATPAPAAPLRVAPAAVKPAAVKTEPTRPAAPPPPMGDGDKGGFLPRDVDWADFLGARALAIAGGLVTVLGIVFFFALAVNRGWIGPELRVGLGVLTSALVFGGGFELRRRYGDTYAALAAVGAGIAGAYATLLFAAAVYDLVPDVIALVLAAGIASVGLVTALAWSAELVAGFGLVGAMLVPFAVVVTDEITTVGTAFVAVVLAAAGVVSLRKGWDWLLVSAVGASLPQAALLVAGADRGEGIVLALAFVFGALYAGLGLARLLELEDRLEPLGASLVVLGGAVAALSLQRLLDDAALGIGLLAVAALYATLSHWFRVERPQLSALVATIVGASLPQAALLVVGAAEGDAAILLIAAAFAGLYTSLGIWRQIFSRDVVDVVGAGLLAFGAFLAGLASQLLLDGAGRGVALLVVAGVFGALSVGFLRTRPQLSVLLGALVAASLPQAALVVAGADRGDVAIIAVTAAFAALYAAIGVARNLVRGPGGVGSTEPPRSAGAGFAGAAAGTGLDPFGASFVTGSAGFAAVSSLHLLDGTERGIALLVLAVAYGALAAVFFRGRRDLSSLLSAAALILAAGAGGELLSGLGLATIWAAQGAVLAWLAWQTRESRFQLGALGYLGLAAGHALLFEAPPRDLFQATLYPASGAPALVALAAGLVALAFYARHGDEETILGRIGIRQGDLRSASLITASVAATAAASLGLLDLFSTFSWGEVAVTTLWAGVALVALLAGLWRESLLVRVCALVGYGAPLLKAVASDATLPEPQRWYALLAVGAVGIAAGFSYHALQRRLTTLDPIGVLLHGIGLAGGTTAVVELLGSDRLGPALLIVAVVYGALAAVVFARERQRDHATLLWSVSLALAAVAAPQLLDGTLLVAAWAAPAAALALLTSVLREPRFLAASAALTVTALAEAVTRLAPPAELTSANLHPGDGVPALLLALAAGVTLLRFAPLAALKRPGARSEEYGELASSLERLEQATRRPARWIAGLVGLYALSLALLELFERIPGGGVDDRFQRGHTAVSACWALVALGLLYAGLSRRARALRLGGFALFGAALAKLFLYDLASLSSVARALSFLAVGALLLVAGFFYQRLSQQLGLATNPER